MTDITKQLAEALRHIENAATDLRVQRYEIRAAATEALAAHEAEQMSQVKPAPAQAVPAAVARLLHWCGSNHLTVPHGGIAARTFAEFPEHAADAPDSCWKNGALLYTHPPAAPAPEAPTLTHELQQQCSDWGVYWRASDAHGVDLSIEQAEELLRRALGVEVAISKAAPQTQAAGQDERAAFGAWFQGYRHGWKSEKDVTFDAWQARAALAQRQPLTLDAFDEHDLCDSFAGLPVEWFNPGPSFGATAGEHS